MQVNIKEAITRVRTSGQKAAQHERVTEIIDAVCAEGIHIRQGDIILTFTEKVPTRLKLTSERQLAPGNTQGSRHIVEGDAKVSNFASPGELDGPVIQVGDGQCTITHPEHRHYILPAGSCWKVTYERDLAQEEIARMRD